jgi:hypothetical protein
MKTFDEKHVPQNRKALLHSLRTHGWEVTGVDDSEGDWALDLKWMTKSTRENKGATLALWFFKYDGQEDGMNRVVATPPDASQPDSYNGQPSVDFNAKRSQVQLVAFITSLHAYRISGTLDSET